MYNKLINAVIALIEDRPRDAREMLRSPEMRVSSSEVQVRLQKAVRKCEYKAASRFMKRVLNITLKVNPKEWLVEPTPQMEEAFLLGVAYVEELLDEQIGLSEELTAESTRVETIPGSDPKD